LQDTDKLAEKLKRYEVLRPLGSGARGKVYLARDRLIRRHVAIKTIPLEQMAGDGTPHTRNKVLHDFFIETHTAGALLHPNIVVVFDVGKKGDLLYIVMEFVHGKTILEHQRSAGLSLKRSLETVYELAQALDYAHSKGIVHRDIKPENIIISTRGTPKITDFGIARFRRQLLGDQRYLVGSTRFVAPEQILRKDQDHRVDIYQLGVILYELLTRRALFRGETPRDTMDKICNAVPVLPSAINPAIPSSVERIVLRCLEKSPDDRFQRARDFAAAVSDCIRAGAHLGVGVNRELTARLAQLDLFSLFTELEIDQVARVAVVEHMAKKRVILKRREYGSDFWVLVEGRIKAAQGDTTLGSFLPGVCFCEPPPFLRNKLPATLIAESHCKLLRINSEVFKELDPLLQLKLLHNVVRSFSALLISLDADASWKSAGDSAALETGTQEAEPTR
jgi:serine/threonine-protein kinase